MKLTGAPTSTACAFVVQLKPADATASRRRGRVEHVSSGRSARFESLAELPKVIERLLGEAAADPAEGDA